MTTLLMQQLSTLLDDHQSGDVSIMTRDGVVTAHSLILSVRCPVLVKVRSYNEFTDNC